MAENSQKTAELSVRKLSGEIWQVFGEVRDRELIGRFRLPPSGRVRRKFHDEASAQQWRSAVEAAAALTHAGQQLRSTWLSDEHLRDAESARRELDDGVSLLAAVRWYRDHGPASSDAPILPLLEEFLESIERVKGVRERTLENLENRIRFFLDAQGVRRVSQFTAVAIERHLRRKKMAGQSRKGRGRPRQEQIGQRTRINDRAALHRFAGWLVKRHVMRANPASGVEVAEADWVPPAIFPPDEASRLLLAAVTDRVSPGAYVCYFACCLFAGIRPDAEFPFLRWEHFHLAGTRREERDILIYREKRRGASQRHVPVEDALAVWLRFARRKGWPLRKPPQSAEARIRETAKVGWSGDIMRHSYATYSLAMGRTKRDLAEWMGNSERVIETRYANLAKRRRDAARIFWALGPKIVLREEKK